MKEKFWGLRFYVSVSDPVIDGYILEAEREVQGIEDSRRNR